MLALALSFSCKKLKVNVDKTFVQVDVKITSGYSDTELKYEDGRLLKLTMP